MMSEVDTHFFVYRIYTTYYPKLLGAHWVGQSLKRHKKKSLVTLPMGILIPPSINTIIGITTASEGLSHTTLLSGSALW